MHTTSFTKLDIVLLVMVFLNIIMIGYCSYVRFYAGPGPQMASAPAIIDVAQADTVMPPPVMPMAGVPAPASTGCKFPIKRSSAPVECGGVTSKIVTECAIIPGKGKQCRHWWKVNGKTIKLAGHHPVKSWGCTQSQSDTHVVFFRKKGPAQIFTPHGKPVQSSNSASKDFSRS